MTISVQWLSYDFTVYNPLMTTWNDVAGVYVFTGLDRIGRWIALYIGQADSLRNRFSSHEQWSPAVRLGATHVHAMVVPLKADRDRIEQELIQAYQPTLNLQLR
jgi:excinuclease UvrABC nuclease subunit